MSVFTDASSLGEARTYVRTGLEIGVMCPCCHQRAQLYRRTIHSGMARALVVMYRAHGTEWQDKTETLRGLGSASRDEALLRYWGLLEEATERREDGGRAGWWRVTGHGEWFALGYTLVPKYALIYDGKCHGLEGPPVSIYLCLGKRFNLDALLRGEA